jgi:NitT/TauT family transport system substrate-binding protein
MSAMRATAMMLLLAAAGMPSAAYAQIPDRPPPGCSAWNSDLPANWAGWGEAANDVAAAATPEDAAKAAIAVGKKSSVTLAPARGVKLRVETPDIDPPPDAHKGMLSLHVPAEGFYWVAVDSGLWVDVVQDGKILESTDHGPGPRCASIAKTVQFALKAGDAEIQLSDNRGAKVDLMVARASELAPVRIEVPGANNLQFLTLWVAVGAHLFEKEGLAPQILVAPQPRSVGERLFRGEADVALLPPPMFLGMMAEEKPVRLFASLLANEPINLVVRKDIAASRGLSARAALAERLAALKGVRIGLASEVAPRLRALAKAAGLDADKDFRLVTVPGPGQVQAFAGGTVDALFAHTPYLETALVQYDAVLLVQTSHGEVPELTGGQVHALATTRALAAQNPDLFRRVARAIYAAQMLIHRDAKAAVDAIIASGAGKGDRAMVEAIVAVYAPAVPQTPAISLDGIVRDAALYPAHPRAPDFSKMKASDYVAAEFAKSAVSAPAP